MYSLLGIYEKKNPAICRFKIKKKLIDILNLSDRVGYFFLYGNFSHSIPVFGVILSTITFPWTDV